MKLYENNDVKVMRSKYYNYNFDKTSGYFERWGITKEDDPEFAPVPEILDIEVSTICAGPGGNAKQLCPFCYKGNNPNGNNMSFQDFKNIIEKMPWLTQLAFGADAQATANPDLFQMAEYARSKGIIPNITVADISDSTADKLSDVMGAVAVSRYEDKNYCYDSIKKLTDRGMKQVNIHCLLSAQTLPWIYETFTDYLHGEERLKGLNSIVLLSLKKKGRGKRGFNQVDQATFKSLVDFAIKNKIPFGFDSCGAQKFLKSIENSENFKELSMLCEPCESSCFSSYLNVNGDFFPCSFTEGENDWKSGISVLNCQDFVKDVWWNSKTNKFRKNLLNNKRNCPIFEI